MDTNFSSFFETHFDFFNLGTSLEFLSPKMSLFFAYIFSLFAFIKQGFFRLKEKLKLQNTKLSSEVLIPALEEEEEEEEEEAKKNVVEEKMESFLSFRFRSYDEFVGKNGEILNEEDTNYPHNQVSDDENSDDEFFEFEFNEEDDETIVADCTHKTHHVEDIEKPQVSSKIVGFSSDNSVNVEETEETIACDLGQNLEEENVKIEEKLSDSVKDLEKNAHLFSSDDDDESLVSDSDSDSMVSSSKFSLRSSVIDSMSDGFLDDIDFERAFEVDTLMEFEEEESYSSKKLLTEEDIELEKLNKGYETDDFDGEDEDILKELKKLESENGPNDETTLDDEKYQQTTTPSVNLAEAKLEDEQNGQNPNLGDELSKDFEDQTELESENGLNEEAQLENEKQRQTTTSNVNPAERALEDAQNVEKSNSGDELSSDSEDQNELERQWEHQNLVEQLKMEIKKVKAIGLPTILEESETPKITEDLKPWKIEEKFQHEDTLDELHKFYKSYRERMRKLDILNYQKMYAIGFLQLNEPLESFTRNKLLNPSMSAIVALDCWSCAGKSATEVEQPVKMKKLSRELEIDLEMVYVGQMCLSWEFLRWEYGKALKLWDSDLHGIRRYNEVADKFQQFQVLITRFLEDEPFQATRVHHYAKTRCVLKNLLQVPLIQEDDLSDNKTNERKRVSGKDAVTSVKLVEIIEESIRIMWHFIRSDKCTSNVVLLKACGRSNAELQNPADAVLLEQLRSTLQKKEKRLKEVTRSENWILRRIRKHKHLEDGTDHVRYFFSEVDLKLVSRALNMSKISSEQLGWCADKLNKINVVSGKLYVDSSFLLFP